MSGKLSPLIPIDLLYPADAVYMARTDLLETKMLGYTPLHLDTVTAMLVGLLNGRTAIRHECGAGKELFDVYRYAGMQIDEETLTYRSVEEAEALADDLLAQGKRLFSPYPLCSGRFPDSGQLVSPELYCTLNAKINLHRLAPSEFLPERQILSHKEFADFTPSGPVFLKAGSYAATGWGFAVQPCRNISDLKTARQWFAKYRESIPAILVEEWIDVSTCWCAGIAVGEDETICFGGAEQIFSSPARQSGSVIDPENSFPETGKKLATRIGEAARQQGFRGIAGLDIGLRTDGRPVIFDPNFRFNSSSTQLLFHDSATCRSNLPVSYSFQTTPRGKFKTLNVRLKKAIDQGRFVPTRLFNGEQHPHANGTHIVTGFVLGENRKAAEAVAESLRHDLEG